MKNSYKELSFKSVVHVRNQLMMAPTPLWKLILEVEGWFPVDRKEMVSR